MQRLCDAHRRHDSTRFPTFVRATHNCCVAVVNSSRELKVGIARAEPSHFLQEARDRHAKISWRTLEVGATGDHQLHQFVRVHPFADVRESVQSSYLTVRGAWAVNGRPSERRNSDGKWPTTYGRGVGRRRLLHGSRRRSFRSISATT